jgi:hypothetical protein
MTDQGNDNLTLPSDFIARAHHVGRTNTNFNLYLSHRQRRPVKYIVKEAIQRADCFFDEVCD